jgi:hydrogenase nickel incorporation protein HypA/HybF
MHELGIASAILERVEQEAQRRPGVRMIKVGVRVGELSGVDPDALAFGFEALVKDTAWEPLPLDICLCRRKQLCMACGRDFTTEVINTACPHCGNTDTACVGGDELDIEYIEVDEP